MLNHFSILKKNEKHKTKCLSFFLKKKTKNEDMSRFIVQFQRTRSLCLKKKYSGETHLFVDYSRTLVDFHCPFTFSIFFPIYTKGEVKFSQLLQVFVKYYIDKEIQIKIGIKLK
jgi:hypothetical protein